MEISGRVPLFIRFAAPLIWMIIMFHETSYAQYNSSLNATSSCGNISNIHHPFRLTGNSENSGDNDPNLYNLHCENDHTVIYLTNFLLSYHRFEYYEAYCYDNDNSPFCDYINKTRINYKYYVQAINYSNYTIRLVAPNVREKNCSSVPLYPLSKDLFADSQLDPEIAFSKDGRQTHVQLTQTVTFLSCENPVPQNTSYIDTSPCINSSVFSQSRMPHSYVVQDRDLTLSDLEDLCRIELVTLISTRKRNIKNKISTYREIHDELAYGFELSWGRSYCSTGSFSCSVDEDSTVHCRGCEDSNAVQGPTSEVGYPPTEVCSFGCEFPSHARFFAQFRSFLGHASLDFAKKVLKYIAIPRMICVVIVIAIILYTWRKRHSSMDKGIEEFLERNNNLMPIRYSYWEILMMTRGFKDKLGEGGFGTVYKGKLSSGSHVAVKMLGKSKANGQDFINEVATIGKIHHVNVVQLIGFCVTRSKQALIYDFMPNGSLDKCIFLREGVTKLLGYTEIFEISLGVARGIEYLHRGCDMQILHFDIKPHNILLDENFTPKVSDFGLARLCPLENSIVSLTAVRGRGTMGYIAPELYYKNIGRVSHKADVYSFGMLLMEMVSRRKNLHASAEHSSQIYFPLWVYSQFNEEKDMEMENVAEEDKKTIKKMIIVALWCIQLKPCDRPSMNKVIEMLEGEVECLEMPPKPYLYPQEDNDALDHKAEDASEMSSATSSSAASNEDSPEISLISNA